MSGAARGGHLGAAQGAPRPAQPRRGHPQGGVVPVSAILRSSLACISAAFAAS